MNKRTNLTKKRYDRIASIFNMMDQMIRPAWRESLLKNVHGNVLEVGVGTGSNLPYYPEDAHVTGIDFSPKMLAKAYEKVDNTKATVELHEMDAQQMEFPDNTFDFVVSTCVFCSVPNPIKGLKEIRRVIKPEGKVFMLEHMRSENAFVGFILDCMNPLTVRMTGANVNRKTMENIKQAGFEIENERLLMTTIMREIILTPNK